MHFGGAHHSGHQQQLPFGRPPLQLKIEQRRNRVAAAGSCGVSHPLELANRGCPQLQSGEAINQLLHLICPARFRLPGDLHMDQPQLLQPLQGWQGQQGLARPQHYQQRLGPQGMDQPRSTPRRPASLRRIRQPSHHCESEAPGELPHPRFPSPPAWRRVHRAPGDWR